MANRARTKNVLGLVVACAGPAALLVALMLMESPRAPKTQAIVNTPTPTAGPTPTPKANNGAGILSGLFDVALGPPPFARCIVRIDEDSGTLQLKAAARCYDQFGPPSLGEAEPPCAAWHGPGPQGANAPAAVVPGEGNCNGHNAPPPYSAREPTKFIGFYCPNPGPCLSPGGDWVSGDTIFLMGCFADNGGEDTTDIPNDSRVLVIPNASSSTSVGTVLTGSYTSYPLHTSISDCTLTQDGLHPSSGGVTSSMTLTRVDPRRVYCSIPGNCPITLSPSDACTDMVKLWQDKTGSATKCGDDPWNPFQPEGSSPDVSGSYDIRVEAIRADECDDDQHAFCDGQQNDTLMPGLYYNCKADIQQANKALTARFQCYINGGYTGPNGSETLFTVSPAAAGASRCPPADFKYCGGGLPGVPPPGCSDQQGTTSPPFAYPCKTIAGQGAGCPSLPCDTSQYLFASIGTKHTLLTGSLDNTSNMMDLSGCFVDDTSAGGTGTFQLGNVYVQAKVNAHTGQGWMNIYPFQNLSECQSGMPDTGLVSQAQLSMVRQSPGPKPGATTVFPFGCVKGGNGKYTNCRDSDGDGCPDKMELQDNRAQGGLRDPLNRWDFFGPANPGVPHVQNVADIIRTIQQFGKAQGNAAYTIDTDRTALTGGNGWNLGPPDGQQTVADILAAIKQFNQGC